MSKKNDNRTVKPTVKFKKEEYVIKNQVLIGDKTYKKGSKISLTEKGAKYLKSLNKI